MMEGLKGPKATFTGVAKGTAACFFFTDGLGLKAIFGIDGSGYVLGFHMCGGFQGSGKIEWDS